MKWFKHDSDAHRDTKLKKLVMNYGMEAYGLYWHCLEEIANEVSQDKYTFELEHDAEVIAFDTGMTLKKVEEIMKYMISIELFENNNGIITCLKMAKRLDSSMTSNQQMRNIISGIKKNHDPVMTPSAADKKRGEEKRLKDKALSPVVSSFILKNGTYFEVTQEMVDKYKTAYPNVNIGGELAKIRQWCNDNPAKRKTNGGARRFLNSWISNATPTITSNYADGAI